MTWSHLLQALVTQAAIGLATGNWWAGAAFGAAFFIGREITQAEYRWIEKFGECRRANMPWWGPFDLRVWAKADQWLDWIVPSLGTCLVAGLI
ncbi:hypothetical protein [Novosphingobium olei]|uniref:hypothetical protein n=1 Tax=Novosphingobium olei TaxID=2728851 RepID=UPI00308B94A9|nr:hypothetical protein NSDW_11550 [Novosphingobium olei]